MELELDKELRTSSRYRIVSRIANGGMGSVYMAAQHGAAGFRRIVAIKRGFPHLLEDPSFRKLLASEARLASLVRHPNVVAVSDVEEADGELSIVMEYVEGVSLAELLRGDVQLPLYLALRIILDAAEGLDAIHRCTTESGRPLGLVHRDISPQNILVGVDGVARIADFGIAQTYDSGSTGSGMLRGKPAYMAPEYVETSVAAPGCDVFALAVIVWESLAGRRLFRAGTDIETINRVRACVVPPPSTFNRAIAPELDAVVLRALAYEPRLRYPSAIAFAQGLAAAGPVLPLKARTDLGRIVRAVAGPVLAQRRASLSEAGATPVARTSGADLPVVIDASRVNEATVDAPSRPWHIASLLLGALFGVSALCYWGLHAERDGNGVVTAVPKFPAHSSPAPAALELEPPPAPLLPAASSDAAIPRPAPLPGRAVMPTSSMSPPTPSHIPSLLPAPPRWAPSNTR